MLDSLMALITYIALCSGAVFYICSKIPPLTKYKFPLELLGIAIFSYGVLQYGEAANEKKWNAKVAEVEMKLAVSEAKSNEVNTVIQEKLVTKIVKIKDTSSAIIQEVKLNASKIDSNCSMFDSSIMLLNSASKNEIPTSTSGIDGTTANAKTDRIEETSQVKASEVLEVVIENYATCNSIREKLIAWQGWYTEQQKAYQ